jgi:hypothetical protein
MSLLDLRIKYFKNFCHYENGVVITVNPAWLYHEQYQHREAYPRNGEPQWMVHMPTIEVYFRDLRAAKWISTIEQPAEHSSANTFVTCSWPRAGR